MQVVSVEDHNALIEAAYLKRGYTQVLLNEKTCVKQGEKLQQTRTQARHRKYVICSRSLD